jgi:hypothetical protein
LDRLRLGALLLVVLLAAACDGGGRPRHLLYCGPAAEFRPVPGSVVAAGRVLTASALGKRLEECLFGRDRGEVAGDAAVVERVGVEGESLTFADRGRTGVYACDGGVDPAGERRAPWCGSVFGELVQGKVIDPRLDVLCRSWDGASLAYAFVEPVPAARWIGVRHKDYVELYEVLAGLPVRIASSGGVDVDADRATFQVAQYDTEGRELVNGELEAAVAG